MIHIIYNQSKDKVTTSINGKRWSLCGRVLQRARCVFLCGVLVTLFLLSGYIYKRPDVIYGMCDLVKERNNASLEEYVGEYTEIKVGNKNNSFENEASVEVINRKDTDCKVSFNYNMVLINHEYSLGEDMKHQLIAYEDTGFLISKEVSTALSQLFTQAGYSTRETVGITSTYRSKEKQSMLFLEDSNMAAKPGNSEHETGLAVDLIANEYAQRYFIKTRIGRWVNENSYRYGFIIRYPYRKEDITGFLFEPWHLRYVGLPHSEIIYRNRITLEEYLDLLMTGKYYAYYDYLIGAFASLDKILVPKGVSEISISPDNMGRYIVTCRKINFAQLQGAE